MSHFGTPACYSHFRTIPIETHVAAERHLAHPCASNSTQPGRGAARAPIQDTPNRTRLQARESLGVGGCKELPEVTEATYLPSNRAWPRGPDPAQQDLRRCLGRY